MGRQASSNACRPAACGAVDLIDLEHGKVSRGPSGTGQCASPGRLRVTAHLFYRPLTRHGSPFLQAACLTLMAHAMRLAVLYDPSIRLDCVGLFLLKIQANDLVIVANEGFAVGKGGHAPNDIATKSVIGWLDDFRRGRSRCNLRVRVWRSPTHHCH